VKKKFLIISAIVLACATSCVSTKKYQSLQQDYNSLRGRSEAVLKENEDCKNNLGAANVKIAGLQDQLNAERNHLQSLQDALNKCLTSTSQGNTNISKLFDQINESNQYIKELVASKIKAIL
jgi:chemotaxis protein MotB